MYAVIESSWSHKVVSFHEKLTDALRHCHYWNASLITKHRVIRCVYVD